MRIILLALFFLIAVRAIELQFTTSAGSYSISVNGQVWLKSGYHGFRANKKWYTTVDQTLRIKSTSTSSGIDSLGKYTQHVTVWTTGEIDFNTSVNDYTAHSPILIFIQTFPQGANNTDSGDNTDVISAFPSFDLETNTSIHYYSYSNTFLVPNMGLWGPGTKYNYGIKAGAPLNLFDKNLDSLMISPFNNFMVGIHSISSSLKNSFVCGLQGKITSIPVGFSHSTIITASAGVNNAFNYWGSVLLGFYGKKPATVDSDFSVKYLGYWTDNGAYYYYTTEPGKTYSDTIIDIDNYIQSIGIPVKYYQLDSWWYFKGSSSGLVLWEPTPDVFPNGMQYLYNKTGKPFVLHNRWFESDNDYFMKLKFPFVAEQNYSLPLTSDVYDYFMSKAKPWGLIVYEQDWLVDQYLNMQATQTDVHTAHNWMINMNKAAAKNGLPMQLCMPLPIHVLETVLMSQVTQIRASDDYQRERYIQWAIGYSSMVHHALGLFPFKDDFWSTNATQSGCSGPQPCTELYPQLQALVSALSAGPVAPSDKIGLFDQNNIMSTCNNDGLLLKPDVPATTLDIVFQSSFSDGNFYLDPLSHSYSSKIINFNGNSTKVTWHYILAANTDRYYTIIPSDLTNNNPLNEIENYFYFDYFQGAASTIGNFNSDNPIAIPICPHKGTEANYMYYVAAPVLQINNRGYSFLGETNKFITASSQRVSEIDVTYDTQQGVTLTVTLSGAEGEILNLEVANFMSVVETYQCTLDDSGIGTLECIDNGSSQPSCSCA